MSKVSVRGFHISLRRVWRRPSQDPDNPIGVDGMALRDLSTMARRSPQPSKTNPRLFVPAECCQENRVMDTDFRARERRPVAFPKKVWHLSCWKPKCLSQERMHETKNGRHAGNVGADDP